MTDTHLLDRLGKQPKILLIRRDNIGDLVCTTPMIDALRLRFPEAYLAALVNSYNAPVLENNPALNEVFSYDKAKHATPNTSRIRLWIERWQLIRRLRRMHFDLAIIATPTPTHHWFRLAQLAGARDTLAASPRGKKLPRSVSICAHTPPNQGKLHAVKQNMAVLGALGIHDAPGPLRIYPNAKLFTQLTNQLTQKFGQNHTPVIGLHISARKIGQRWPAKHFVELAYLLHAQKQCKFILFWSPGSESNPTHPGDDEKAKKIIAATLDLPIFPWPTQTLPELVVGLATLDFLVCSDGGAMHLAAALDKPIVCLFGNSDPVVWHPWGVPCRVIQPPSKIVSDVTAAEVQAALHDLEAEK
jgi:heptosyltransferase-3